MVREVNKISLYEAIRKKKEEGLAKSQQPQPIPQQGDRREPRIHLKQPPVQKKQVLDGSQPVKPAGNTALSFKTLSHKSQRQRNFNVFGLIRDLVSDKSWIIWFGVGFAVICLMVLVFKIGSSYGTRKVQTDGDKVAQIQIPEVPKTEQKAKLQRTTELTPQPEAPKETKKEDLPQPIKSIEPKPQLPQAIQNELQKPAEPVVLKPVPTGDNTIVIVAYTKEKDLLPVQDHYKKNGIETETIKRGSYYLLITKDRFENPNREGTEGYKVNQKIRKIGASYKAPEGFEPFGATPFQDAYPMKIK